MQLLAAAPVLYLQEVLDTLWIVAVTFSAYSFHFFDLTCLTGSLQKRYQYMKLWLTHINLPRAVFLTKFKNFISKRRAEGNSMYIPGYIWSARRPPGWSWQWIPGSKTNLNTRKPQTFLPSLHWNKQLGFKAHQECSDPNSEMFTAFLLVQATLPPWLVVGWVGGLVGNISLSNFKNKLFFTNECMQHLMRLSFEGLNWWFRVFSQIHQWKGANWLAHTFQVILC